MEKIFETISKPFSIASEKNTLNIKKYITEKLSIIDESLATNKKNKKSKRSQKPFSSFANEKYSISEVYEDKDQN